jgi:hypothetical protein
MEPMLRRLLVVNLFVVVASFGGAQAVAGDEPKDAGPFARGFGYVGAFYVTQSSTEIRLFSTDLPLGARLNVEKDLGVRDSFTVPRMTLGWRFGKRHVLTGGYYDLSRDGVKRLDRTIELPGDIEFPVGVKVATTFTIRVSKLQYTYLFHRDEKVTLGIGAGLFVARLGAGLSITGNVGPQQQTPPAFHESITAPLPVFGFRLTYRITKKWGVFASSDWFLLNYNDQDKGILSDTQIYAAHRTFKHVGFAGGLNIQTFGVELEDDDLLWQLDAGLVGLLGAVTFYF